MTRTLRGGIVLDMQVEGIENLVRQVGDPELTRGPMLTLFREATAAGDEAARSKAGAGTAGASILSEASSTFGRVYSTLPAPMAHVLESGRRPDGRMPPVDPIAQWAATKGIDGGAAFPIARAIARRGLKGRFFMRAARGRMRGLLPSLAQNAARDIVAKWRVGL